MEEEKRRSSPDDPKKKDAEEKKSPAAAGRSSTVIKVNPFANARSKCRNFFPDRIRTRTHVSKAASCKNCGAPDHDVKSCLERPRAGAPFRVQPLKPQEVKLKKIEVKQKKIEVKSKEEEKQQYSFDTPLPDPNKNFVRSGESQKNVSVWELESEKEKDPPNFGSEEEGENALAVAEELKDFKKYMKNLHDEENELEKPKKKKPGIGYILIKKMGYEDGKGLGKNGDGILEPLVVTQLPKQMGLGAALSFIEDKKGKRCIGGKARKDLRPPPNCRGAATPQNNMGGCPPNAGWSRNNNYERQSGGHDQDHEYSLARYLFGDEELAAFKQYTACSGNNNQDQDQDQEQGGGKT